MRKVALRDALLKKSLISWLNVLSKIRIQNFKEIDSIEIYGNWLMFAYYLHHINTA